MTTDPNTLLAASACLKCISNGVKPDVMIYLLQQLAGNTMTPNQLMAQASCNRCIPDGMKWDVAIYLLTQIATTAGA
jgi:hypothetical protein